MSFRPVVFPLAKTTYSLSLTYLKPQSLEQLRSVHVMVTFVRCFIKYYAELSAPLVAFTWKDYAIKRCFQKGLGDEQDEAFDGIKRVLQSAPVLYFPDFSRSSSCTLTHLRQATAHSSLSLLEIPQDLGTSTSSRTITIVFRSLNVSTVPT